MAGNRQKPDSKSLRKKTRRDEGRELERKHQAQVVQDRIQQKAIRRGRRSWAA